MLTNFCRARISTHGLMVAIGVLAFFARSFMSDPNAAAYINQHWIVRDLYQSISMTLVAYGIYRTPTKQML